MGSRRFKVSKFTDDRGVNWNMYESTNIIPKSKLISDAYHKKDRIRHFGSLGSDFVVKVRKRR